MSKAPKPWKLTEDETFSSFTSWQHNIIYTLSREKEFKPFLADDCTWLKDTNTTTNRGFQDDIDGLTGTQKAANLSQMLGLISQWIPHYLAADVSKNSTSLDGIWQAIRKYYGFQQSEAQFMRFTAIQWEDGERPERLFQRILAHLQDNLLQKDCKLRHNGESVKVNEDLSPTVERLAVLHWMQLLHPGLPALVMRTFAYDLQRMTLKDMQPQIVDALDGFLEELRGETVKAARTYLPDNKPRFSQRPRMSSSNKNSRQKPSRSKECRLCKGEGRPSYGHTISECDFLSRAEMRNMVRSFRVDLEPEPELVTSEDDQEAA